MAQYRINKPVAVAYALAAALVTGGGGYYYNANIDEWRHEAALLKSDNRIRTAIAEQLPLTREITALVPGAAYPPAPEIAIMPSFSSETRPVSMTEAFTEADHILRDETMENPYRACAILDYLRDVHRVAVAIAAYSPTPESEMKLTTPLARHRAMAGFKIPPCKP